MNALERYLGVAVANTPATVSAESGINTLIHRMRDHGVTQLERTASRVPCLIREDAEGLILHPVLGAGGEGYADVMHTDEAIRIKGERIPGSGRIWSRDLRNGKRDILHLSFSIYHDEGRPEKIGPFAHRPEGTSWTELDITSTSVFGYIALHVALSAAQEDDTRKMVLFGEDAPTPSVLEELPCTDDAANILMGQASLALQKCLGSCVARSF